MIEKFNGIFYLIIYLVHFIGVGVYAFQTIFGTKSFMERFGIDPSGAIMIRMAGAFMLAVFLMSIYVGFIRPGGLENTCCLLYTSPSPRDGLLPRMPSSA